MNKKHFYAAVILLLFLAVGIQPALAIDIPGDTAYYDIVEGTYVLNQNVFETIHIKAGGITLDGAGNTVDGTESGFSVGVNNIFKDDVTIKNLNITGFPYGIWLAGSSNNTVTGNTVNGNVNAGIWLTEVYVGGFWYGSDDNTLTGNTIKENNIGMNIQASSANKIYNNNFINNSVQAQVIQPSSGNVFDLGDPAVGDGKGGNYWSDYTGVDRGDGIGEPPYTSGVVQDNYPWTIENGWLSPELLIVQLIDTVAEMNLQQGIDNSLDAKLDAAYNALDDINQNNDVAAINSLNSFKNAVEAQRGNKINDAQADELIADANYIIYLLGG